MDEPIAKKTYYSIGEVCEITELKPHVLRYWETQFKILRPKKNRAGNRVFRPEDIELVLLVKYLLYEKKFTIDGAQQKLLNMKKQGDIAEDKRNIANHEFLASMRQNLNDLKEILIAPETRLPS